ncbi:MAG: hypothetical protein WCI75_17835 [candidate division NC10 bacterium]
MAHLTCLRTWSGFYHVAFIMDAQPCYVHGWRTLAHLCSDLALGALEIALY